MKGKRGKESFTSDFYRKLCKCILSLRSTGTYQEFDFGRGTSASGGLQRVFGHEMCIKYIYNYAYTI